MFFAAIIPRAIRAAATIDAHDPEDDSFAGGIFHLIVIRRGAPSGDAGLRLPARGGGTGLQKHSAVLFDVVLMDIHR